MTDEETIGEVYREIADLYNQKERIEKSIEMKYRYIGKLGDQIHNIIRPEKLKMR